ncbi:MAG: aminotransferase class V-fold PLP-dependent enzyme, partial [Phycisphaerales bacterium]|nr:aminotransferase class V-fold PLP-dependent enzyme [Phycisphaerales bacterium]
MKSLFDPQRIRRDFPILHQQVNGKPLVYLDNAASSQRPRAVIEAVKAYEEHDHANIHRGVHTLSVRATNAYEAARDKVARFVNAARREEIIFVRGTTEAINLVAQAYARPRLKAGDEIVLTRLEHHSNIVPWQMVCEQVGARIRVTPVNAQGELLVDEFEKLLSDKTRIVAFGHVSNALGSINPVRRMADLAHSHGAVTVIDGAQAAPHLPIDVRALRADFYAFSGHKAFGPTGIGAL